MSLALVVLQVPARPVAACEPWVHGEPVLARAVNRSDGFVTFETTSSTKAPPKRLSILYGSDAQFIKVGRTYLVSWALYGKPSRSTVRRGDCGTAPLTVNADGSPISTSTWRRRAVAIGAIATVVMSLVALVLWLRRRRGFGTWDELRGAASSG